MSRSICFPAGQGTTGCRPANPAWVLGGAPSRGAPRRGSDRAGRRRVGRRVRGPGEARPCIRWRIAPRL